MTLESLAPILGYLVNFVIVAILTPLAAWGVPKLIHYLEKRYDFDVAQRDEEKIQQLLEESIAFIEEESRSRLKRGGIALSSDQKDKGSLEYLLKRLGEENLAGKVGDMIKSRLIATLGASRPAPSQSTSPLP